MKLFLILIIVLSLKKKEKFFIFLGKNDMYWKAYLSLLMISDITFYALLRFVLPQELFFVLFCNFKVSSVIIFNIKYTLSYFGYRVFVEMYFKCILKLEYISISTLGSLSLYLTFQHEYSLNLSYQDYSRIPFKKNFSLKDMII